MTVPYTFGTATTSIPLSNLDANFNTPITLGNTSIYLGNTTTTIGNLTLTNATISSGNVTLTNVSVTTANVTNITVTGTANIATGNVTTLTSTSITDSGLTSGRVTYAGASGLLTDSANLVFNGTQLGIGTTPAFALDVNGDAKVSNAVRYYVGATQYGVSFANAGAVGTEAYQGTYIYWGTGSGASATERLRLTSTSLYTASGVNVGIGTSSPTNLLHLVSSAGTQSIVQMGQTARGTMVVGMQASGAVPANAVIGTDVTGNILFKQGVTTTDVSTGTAIAIFDSSGNLGVNITTPVSKLDVRSTAGEIARFVTKASAGECYILVGADASTTEGLRLTYDNADGSSTINNFYPAALKFRTNNTQRMSIDLNGIVTMNAYGVGTATFSATGVISSVSDETWKTKDGVPTNPDAMLQKLEPGYWFYNEEKAPIFGEDRQLGFYAQNVHEAIGAEAAPTPEEGKPWGYYDRSVLAVAVMSLKNALNTIEELKQRITVLENK